MEGRMAKLRKAKNISLVKDVSQQIEEAILTKEYQPGDRLPTTRDLQEILGASLGTIRESLAILEQKGLLEVRKGSKGGFFVREITTTPMINSMETLMQHMVFSHRELYEFRIPVEVGLIRIVTKKATADQIKSFRSYLNKFKECLGLGNAGWVKLVEIEQNLRRLFLNVADNRIYEAVLTPMLDTLSQYAFQHLPGGDSEVQLAHDYWEKIINAMANRDEERASTLVSELLLRFETIIITHPANRPSPSENPPS